MKKIENSRETKKVYKKTNNFSMKQTLEEILYCLFESYSNLSLEEILNKYEETIDNFILESIEYENLKYIAGTLTLTKVREGIKTNIECYFQDENNKWIKKEAEDIIKKKLLEKDCMKEKQIKYEIDNPK